MRVADASTRSVSSCAVGAAPSLRYVVRATEDRSTARAAAPSRRDVSTSPRSGGGIGEALQVAKHTESRSVAVAVVNARLPGCLGTPPMPIPWAIRLLRSMSPRVGSRHGVVRPGVSRPRPSRVGCRRSGGARFSAIAARGPRTSSPTAVGSPDGALGIADQRGPDSTVKSRRKTSAVNRRSPVRIRYPARRNGAKDGGVGEVAATEIGRLCRS